MRSLIDFFNHGILPFVGRSRELDRLERFFRESAEAHGLRAALVLGEAGAGKSRLVEELLPRVTAAGGLIVHTKFYPGTSTSIASLVAAALATSSTARGLLKKEPDETVGSTITALQRLARLRPVMLVIEDIHLLEGDSRAEFISFLEGIADETIALLCLARPADLAARGIIERYIVDEMRIDGVEQADVLALWRHLFDSELDAVGLEALHGITAGTPLALRTALRAALKSSAIDRDASGRWHVAVPVEEFATVLERNVTLLAEGMAAHLSGEERRNALQLAGLGEIFTREAARHLVDDAERVIDVLTFKGILAPPTVAGAPLPPGRFSAYPPIAFVHTLLHRSLADQIVPDRPRLIALVASEAPLYSALPYQLIADHVGDQKANVGAPREIVRRAIDRSLAVAASLDRTTEWPLGMTVLAAAEALASANGAEWSDEEDRELRILLLSHRLELMRRDNSGPEYAELLDQLAELTADDLPAELLPYRLSALQYRFLLVRRVDIDEAQEILDEVDALVEGHPELRFSERYVEFLAASSQSTGRADDRDILNRSERMMNAILESADASEEFRTMAFRRLGPNFLWRFATSEELADRWRLLERLEAIADVNDMVLPAKKAAFLQGTGHVDATIELLDQYQPRLRDHGYVRQIHSTNLLRLYALGWRVQNLADLDALAERMIADAPPLMANWMRERSGVHLVRIGLLHDDAVWSRDILDRYLGAERASQVLPEDTIVLLAYAEGRLEEALRELYDEGRIEEELQVLVHAALDIEPVAEERLRTVAEELLGHAILTREDITRVLIFMHMIELAATHPRYAAVAAELRDDIRYAVVRILEWLHQRGLGASMHPMLRMTAAYLGDKERASWLERIEALERQQASAARLSEPPRLRISMLGSIDICHAHDQPVRVRGARLRTLLGLMTADRMLDRPLSLREFQRIASGGEDDPERARKTTSMGVLRLRETIGAEAVLTDGETPRLNLQHVSVDLLDAHERLEQAARAVDERAWVIATRALQSALAITRGQVPFPGLYEDFFEAARDDFEYALRTAVINVARGLIVEGDPATAVEILSRGFEAMPEDEEIVELLRDALIKVGRRTEAERVRLRATETALDE
jgi:hypothetical protein